MITISNLSDQILTDRILDNQYNETVIVSQNLSV